MPNRGSIGREKPRFKMNTQRPRFQTINSGMLLKMGIVLSLLFMSLYVQAKTDKIKYHKYLIYTGDVLEKQPFGKGSLVLLNPENKEQTLMQITGSFIKNTIEDGVLTFPFKQGISFKGTIIADIVENNGVSLSMKLNGELSNVNGNIKIGTNDIKSVTVNDLDMYCELEKKSKAWIFTLGSNRTESIEKEVILNDIFTLPNLLASFDYSFSDLRAVKTHVNIDFNIIKPTDGVITYEFTDGATYKEPHLNYPNGDMITVDLENILKSKGTRMIANGIKLISNGENDCELIYPNGDKYQGTIMGKAVYLMGRDASTKTVTYKDGVFTSGNKTEKWFNGESFSKRHERLVQVMDSDLWVAVENETMAETAAMNQQNVRNSKKKYEEEQKIKENKPDGTGGDVLKKYFGKSSVTFKCDGTGVEYSLAKAGLAEIGMSLGDFVYHATLYLGSDGYGTFSYTVNPSEQARRNNRIHYKRNGMRVRHYDYVNELCSIVSGKDSTSGNWKIEDGVISVGNRTFQISDDNKSVTWDFWERCTLKIQ